jgi:hypothetical protein
LWDLRETCIPSNPTVWHDGSLTLYGSPFVNVNQKTKGRNTPASGVDGTVFCGILGEGFDKLVDCGELGEAAVFLTALSKASNRFRMSGMSDVVTDADILTLEPQMAPCLLYS